MPLTLLLGALTLAPLVAALAVAALGLAKRALPPAVFALAAAGALVPALCLLVLAPYLASGDPLRAALFGGVVGPTAWFSPVYRADAFSLYTGLGLAFLVAPVLLWLAWKGPTVASAADEDAEDDIPVTAPLVTGLAQPVWGGIALALAAEASAMTLLFSDNILWLGLSWVVLAALVWGLGEIGADGGTMDRAGLIFMLAGPVLWVALMLTTAGPTKAPTLYDLMGHGSFSVIQVILLALILALAGGAYPFAIWVRRRAVFATPAGLGAVTLALLPVALYVGARTYSAAQNAASAWPAIGKATPPVTAGIAFALLGAVTVGVAGLMALERRDVRSTLALLAVAQVGWGFLALGTGEPGGVAGLTVLLAMAVFGLGAMLCAAFAGETLGDEDERDGAGPRPFGAAAKTANLVAWCVGAVSVIGAPLFGGFVARQILAASALQVGNLTIPLVGLAWAGDGLLAIALLRLTAPAFTSVWTTSKAALEGEAQSRALTLDESSKFSATTDADDAGVSGEVAGVRARDMEMEADFDVDIDELDEIPATAGVPNDLRELPGLVFAALALVVGIAPQLLLNFGATLAASDLVQYHAMDGAVRTLSLGYTSGSGQWLPTLAWLALVVLVVVFALLRPGGARVAKPALFSGQAAADVTDPTAATELATMPHPADTWRDLTPALASVFTLPAGEWLLPVTDEEAVDELTEADEARPVGAPGSSGSDEPRRGDTAAPASEAEAAEPEPFVEAATEEPAETNGSKATATPLATGPRPAKVPTPVTAQSGSRTNAQGATRGKSGKSGRNAKKGGR